MLEPCEGKLSCTVLRGEGGSNTADLLDPITEVTTEDILEGLRPFHGSSHPRKNYIGAGDCDPCK